MYPCVDVLRHSPGCSTGSHSLIWLSKDQPEEVDQNLYAETMVALSTTVFYFAYICKAKAKVLAFF